MWVDGVHFNIRLEDDGLCTLVMMGVRADGTKELVALEDGYRESAESWANVLDKLPRRPRAKRALHDVMYAPTKAAAETAIGTFVAEFKVKYPKAKACRWTTRRLC